jgi:hypothetical protein
MAQCKERRRSEYVDISRLLDAALGHSGQIPSGRWNGFHIGQQFVWKGNQPSPHKLPTDMFAIPVPRRCN